MGAEAQGQAAGSSEEEEEEEAEEEQQEEEEEEQEEEEEEVASEGLHAGQLLSRRTLFIKRSAFKSGPASPLASKVGQ